MEIQDEIKRVMISKEDILKADQDRENQNYHNALDSFVKKLKYTILDDAKKGCEKSGYLCGRMTFDKGIFRVEPTTDWDSGVRSEGVQCPPLLVDVTIKESTGLFKSVKISSTKMQPTKQIMNIYEHLKEWASMEGISLSDLYIFDEISKKEHHAQELVIPHKNGVHIFGSHVNCDLYERDTKCNKEATLWQVCGKASYIYAINYRLKIS